MKYSALAAYATACVALCANLMLLWVYSGFVHGRTNTALDPEDAARFGASLVKADPPEVAPNFESIAPLRRPLTLRGLADINAVLRAHE